MKAVRFKSWNCHLQVHQYGNGRPALVLVDQKDGQRVAVASVNIPDLDLKDGEVAIKNYSENEGMVEALMAADVIERPHSEHSLGRVRVPIARLKVPAA